MQTIHPLSYIVESNGIAKVVALHAFMGAILLGFDISQVSDTTTAPHFLEEKAVLAKVGIG